MSMRFELSSRILLARGLSLSLTLCILGGHSLLPSLAAHSDVLTGGARVTVDPSNLKTTLPIQGADRKVTMSFHGLSIQDALRALAQKGGFNVLVDDSVSGNISLDLNNVTIQDALESLKACGNLAYSVQGANLMVTDASSDKAKTFKKTATRIFHLRNGNARVIADMLNNTLFADRLGSTGASSGGGGGGAGSVSIPGGMPVTPDYHTNSLIVVGEPMDIKAVADHLEILDKPRESKTWRLSQANVLDVATILASSVFNEGIPILNSSGSSSSTTSGSSLPGTTPASVRAVADNIQEGANGNTASQSGGGGSSSSVNANVTLRSHVKAMQMIQVSPLGPIILPDTRLNTLTLMGTAEQIAMAEAMIPMLDRKIPQVVLETALVEITDSAQKELGLAQGTHNVGPFNFNSTNVSSGTSGSGLKNVFGFSTSPITRNRDTFYQLNALINQNKAKMLANPTIITASDHEAIVSIVDEVVRSVTITQGAVTGSSSVPSITVNLGEVGIVLNLLPKVSADHSVTLRVRPVISTIADTKTAAGGLVTLLSKREVLTQSVQLADGETFVLGGLVQNTNKEIVSRIPGLSSLPILSALARNSVQNKKRSELVIMITPHIINDDSEVAKGAPGKFAPGILPATLSKNFSHVAEDNILPVSLNGDNHPSALPPLEKTHEIKDALYSRDVAGESDLAQPAPRPSGALLQDELKVAPRTVSKPVAHKADTIVPVSYQKPMPEPAKAASPAKPAHAKVSAPPPADTSDEAIRAIMEKFKQPF